MRVGFDAHHVGEQQTGNETYAIGLLHGFEKLGFAVDAYAFRPLPIRFHRMHRLWPHQSLVRIPFTTPLLAGRDRLDLYHATYTLPPLLPCASVVTVHDITFDLHPEWFPARLQRTLHALVPLAMRHASRVITISENTKRDIVERYRIAPEKIAVTYLAPRPHLLTPVSVPPAEPFFLFVGNVEPRKNVETVLKALGLLRDRGIEVPLVIVGKLGLRHANVQRLVHRLHLAHLVRFTGYVSDSELRELYATCVSLVHPALYEGFGITPLEVMAHGAPAIVSNSSSLPEVAGDAALLVAPLDVEAWADSMETVVKQPQRRQELVCRGRARAALFSWEQCARDTVEVYRAALQRA